ncbi:hypothetical protein N7495_002156 [Penicillium taxi]|uniref:uncharacterized protein n=1 Tax=Penicillium taxi TaxID=168475 RepID=UPI00254539CC|nr:uncharacterized protein N7495_002156 [Penicillium taxi]KAJ5901628.1 hypothetical protein N7495_002156 [Penicillium taxi]
MLFKGTFLMLLPLLGISAALDMPTMTSWNPKGSSMCKHMGDHCEKAATNYSYHNSTVFKEYTSFYDAATSISLFTGSHDDYGCAAMFKCKDGKYDDGMTGEQIYNA